MSLLTDDDLLDLARGKDDHVQYGRAVVDAVIKKLAGVSVEPVGSFHVTHFKQSFCMRNIEFQEHIDFAAGDHYLYSAEQLAAARVQENERCARVCRRLHREQQRYFGALGSAGCPEYGPRDCEEAIRALIGGDHG